MMRKVVSANILDIISILFCLFFTIAGLLVALNRYWQYEIFYYDFGIFDQAIWRVSRFQAPIIDHLAVGGKWIFADHFNPTIFLLSPFYWFTQKSEIILVLQAIIVGLSGMVLYKIGLELLGNRFLSLSILISYLLFIGLQNAVISDFHEVTISTLPLMLTFLMIVKKKIFWYFVFLILALGVKESVFIVGIGIGIFVILSNRQWTLVGLASVFISSVWGFLTIKILIPYFSGGTYYYFYPLPSRLDDVVTAMIDNPTKRNTLFYSFLSFGFLPPLSPQFWFLIFQDFFVRFIPNYGTRWGLGLHYSAQLAVILSISSIYGMRLLQKIKLFSNTLPFIGLALILNSIILYRFVLHGPLALAYNPDFYSHTKDFQFLDDLVKKIPRNASVMAQNNLAVRFTHQEVWLLRDDYQSYKPDYIVIDTRGGQNPNNFFGVKNFSKTVQSLKKDENYSAIYKTDEQFIFKRKNRT